MKKNAVLLAFAMTIGLVSSGCMGDFFPPRRAKSNGPPEKVIWPKNTPRIPEDKPKSKAKPKPPSQAAVKEAPDTTSDFIIKNAAVEEVDVLVMESYPPQIMAVITGTLPDKATKLNEVEQTRTGSTVRLILTTKRERKAQAAMTLIPFKKNIPVTTDGLEEGTYQLDVNGVKKSFSYAGKGKSTTAPTLNSNPSSLPPPVELPPPAASADIPVVNEPETPPVPEVEKPAESAPVLVPPVEPRPIAPVAPGVVLPN